MESRAIATLAELVESHKRLNRRVRATNKRLNTAEGWATRSLCLSLCRLSSLCLSLSLSSTACGVTIARFALAQEVDSMHHQHSQPGGTIGKPPSDVTCSVQLDC
jgi:hypothetical protein